MLQVQRLEDRVTPAAGSKPPILNLPTSFTTGELISQLHSNNPLQDLSNVVTFLNLSSQIDVAKSRVEFGSVVSIALKVGANPTAVAATLDAVSIFDWVTPNYVYVSGSSSQTYLERIPNDPRYGEQWPWPRIDAATAWDTTTGSNRTIVAVIDDGIDLNHPDLAQNILLNTGEIAGDGIDNDQNGFVDDLYGWDFANSTNNANPDDPTMNIHGTQIAGLLAARFDNAAGVTGIAGTIKLLPMKVVGNGPVTSLSLARAAAYSVSRGAQIISTSLNLDPLVGDPVFSAAVDFAYDRGVLWFNSAGNAGAQDPARTAFEQILFVSATDRNDRKTYYSNYGNGVDISAPGGDPSDPILTTVPRAAGTYGYGYGTSFSTPIAAGVAALIWSAFPGLTRDQVASRLSTTADDLNALNPNYWEMLGSGRVNAGSAISASSVLTRLGSLNGLPTEGHTGNAFVTDFVLHLPNPLAKETVTSSSFELRGAGLDDTFGTSDDVIIPLAINNAREYALGTNDLHFRAEGNLSAGLFRFTAFGDRLRDPFGNKVDGDADGNFGGDLIRRFGAASQAQGRVFIDIGGDGIDDPTDPGLSGVPVFVDFDNDGQLDTKTGTSPILNVPIPDNNTNGVTSTIMLSGVTNLASHVTVTVSLKHTYPSDLVITITGPTGLTTTLLRNRVLATGANGELTLTFDDFASAISSRDSQGRIRPEDALAAFDGTDANGLWTLTVRDTSERDVGTLVSWSVSVSEEPVIISGPDGRFSFTGLEPGTSGFTGIVLGPDWQQTKAGNKPVIDLSNQTTNRNALSFGVARPNAIYGRVLKDNGDSTFGPTDPGFAGIVVYSDANGNSKCDPNELFVVTDANGNYALNLLGPGTHTLRLEAPAAFPTMAPVSGFRTVTIGNNNQPVFGSDFLLSYDAASDVPDIRAIAPNPRSTAIDRIEVTLSQPRESLSLADFTLTRNGMPISLAGATVIGTGTQFTIIGLNTLTVAEGEYQIRFTLPTTGPIGPLDINKSTSEVWSVDTTAPTATLNATAPSQLSFSETVTGLQGSSFSLKLNGVPVPTNGLVVSGSGASYTLQNLNQFTQTPGQYTLTLNGTGVTDLAGNTLTPPASISFSVTVPYRDRFAVGADAGGNSLLKVYDPGSGGLIWQIFAFEPEFTGGVRVATADVNGDGVADVIAGAGPGRVPEVRIFDGLNGNLLGNFQAFESAFTGGVFVAAADFNADGKAELVITPDQGGGPRTRVLADMGTTVMADFFAIEDTAFRGGARAAVGDVNKDGVPDLIVSAGFGGGPRIAGYDGAALRNNSRVKLFADFFAFEQSLRNGAYVAVGDVNGDGYADIITAGGPGGGPRVQILNGLDLTTSQTRVVLANFFAGNTALRNGVRVGVKDIDGDGKADVLTSAGPGTTVRTYFATNILANTNPQSDRTFDAIPTFSGGVFVG